MIFINKESQKIKMEELEKEVKNDTTSIIVEEKTEKESPKENIVLNEDFFKQIESHLKNKIKNFKIKNIPIMILKFLKTKTFIFLIMLCIVRIVGDGVYQNGYNDAINFISASYDKK